MSSSSSPCAACKFLRRKCTQGCVFAPYFPPDQPHKFAHVHRVFGASNVAKLLNELPPAQREDAVNSLAYEAEARLRDPVYGCVRYISVLQTKLKEVQHDLNAAKRELAAYIGPVAMGPYFQPHQTPHSLVGYASNSQSGLGMAPYGGMPPNMGLGLGTTMMQQQQQQHQQQQQLLEVQQQALMAVAREHELIRRHYDQQHRFNSVFDAREQQQQQQQQQQQEAGFVPELVLLPSQTRMDNQIHLHHHQQQQQQFEEQQQQQQQFEEQQQQQQQQQHNRSGSDEVRSGGAGPSS